MKEKKKHPYLCVQIVDPIEQWLLSKLYGSILIMPILHFPFFNCLSIRPISIDSTYAISLLK